MKRSDARGGLLRRRASVGFSYLWLLLLVALMGLGLVVAVDIDSTAVQREREKELLSIGRQFRSALRSYQEAQGSMGKKEYPATLDDLLQDARFPGLRRHLRKVFVDPMTGKSEWGLVRVNGRIVGVHSLSERHPIKVAGFDGDDTGFNGAQSYAGWVFSYPVDVMVQPEKTRQGMKEQH